MAESAAKKAARVAGAAKADPTPYQVQRVAVVGIDDPIEGAAGRVLWEDVTTVATSSGGIQAIKLAAAKLGTKDEPSPGLYRAFPSRSDSQLDVGVEPTVKVTYKQPVRAVAAPESTTNGGTTA